MNILLINHYAGSPEMGMEYRPYFFAKHWTEKGHPVTIVASSYSHLRKKNPRLTQTVQEERIDGVRYVWLKGIHYSGNGARRALSMFAFVGRIFLHARKILNGRPDLVIASSTYPLDIFASWWLARRYGAKLVFEVHDLWPLSPMELGGMSRWHPFIVLMQLAENFAYKHSDSVVSLLPCAKEHMIEHGMDPDKFIYVPNGICSSEWSSSSAPAPEALSTQVKQDQGLGYFTVAYAGAHGVANALDNLLEAASLVQDQPIRFYLIGPGPERPSLMRKATERGLKNVTFVDAVPKTAIPATLELFDALYVGLQKQPLFRFGVSPNKVMDYMMAGKPILSAIEAGNDLVAEASCGYTVPAEDPRALADAVLRMAALQPNEKAKMGQAGRLFVSQKHDYEMLADSFLMATKREIFK